jgi:hypothetical protein
MKRTPSRVTRSLFQLSCAAASTLFFFSALGAIGYPLIDVVPPNQPPMSQLLFQSGLCATVAFGAYHIAHWRLFGLPLVFLAPLAFEVRTDSWVAIAYFAFALLVFGAPFLIASRNR